MILYFTGTGNSRFVAEQLAEKTSDGLLSLNEILKNDSEWVFHSERPFVFVVPVYAWRFPKEIEEILKKGEFQGNNRIYLIGTMGASAGNAGKYAKDILAGRGLTAMGFAGIRMPDNYVISFRMMSHEDAVRTIRKSLPQINQIAETIRREEKLSDTTSKLWDGILSGAVNKGFRHFVVEKKRFSVSTDCIQCKKCIQECPVNNITMKNEKITFGEHCMFCLRCIHKCPVHAIDCRGKAKKHGYYSCPSSEEILSELEKTD